MEHYLIIILIAISAFTMVELVKIRRLLEEQKEREMRKNRKAPFHVV
ncbi:MAG: hypothetical protein WKF97_22920 [Chitinophagaceae bacterium]